jgi:RNA polymerase sigma-70 factor, ECF subfamily
VAVVAASQAVPDEATIEQSLLRDAQKGDYDAYEALHQRLEPSIKRYVRRLIADPQTCEDIVQDTFLALYLNLSKIEPLSNLRPYVFRIARNACYDLLRKHRRYDEVSIDEDEREGGRLSFDLRDAHSTPPDDVAHWLLLKLEVEEVIDRLPPDQREVLLLYCEEEMTYAEIAETLDISIGTVKSRLFYAKKTLRGRVKPEVLLAVQDKE